MDALRSQLQGMCLRLARPFWMLAPHSWAWRRPDGVMQTLYIEDEPGVTNLLWLAMDMKVPPRTYQLGQNELAMSIVMFAPTTVLEAGPLAHAAAVLSLRDFAAWLPTKPVGGNALAQAIPLLKLFAERRLRNEQ